MCRLLGELHQGAVQLCLRLQYCCVQPFRYPGAADEILNISVSGMSFAPGKQLAESVWKNIFGMSFYRHFLRYCGDKSISDIVVGIRYVQTRGVLGKKCSFPAAVKQSGGELELQVPCMAVCVPIMLSTLLT